MIYKRSCEKTNTITEEEKNFLHFFLKQSLAKGCTISTKKNEKCVAPYGEILVGSVQPAMLGQTKTNFLV